MAVHIRLSRAGAKKRPFYRIIVADHRSPRGGRFLENIGTYDPTREPVHLVIDQVRLTFWRARGALPSATVDRLIKRQAKIATSAASTSPAVPPEQAHRREAPEQAHRREAPEQAQPK
jgi:small subunit ribosomal protein S16